MAFLELSIQGGLSCLPTFGYLFIILSRVPEPKLVELSSLAMKVEALIFPLFCSEIEENFQPSNFNTCHFKASEDITTNFSTWALDNNINKWQKVGEHD